MKKVRKKGGNREKESVKKKKRKVKRGRTRRNFNFNIKEVVSDVLASVQLIYFNMLADVIFEISYGPRK